MLPANGNELLLGRGSIFADRLVGGVSTGFVFLGNCESITIATEDERQEKFSSTQAASGKIAEAVSQRTMRLAIEGGQFNTFNLSLVLMGEGGLFAQTGETVTDERLATGVVLGRYYWTQQRLISAYTLSVGATELVEDDGTEDDPDYRVIDAASGLIQILEGGAIVEADDNIDIDYTSGAVSLPQVLGGVSSTIECALRFLGDPARGPAYELEIWKASIRPEGELGLISQEFANWQMQAEILDDSVNHPTVPFYRLLQRAA